LIQAWAVHQLATFEAATIRAGKGHLPHPRALMPSAQPSTKRCAKEKERTHHPVHLSGHGHIDMASLSIYLGGELQDYAYPASAVQAAWLPSSGRVEDRNRI
jgi:tryptophan synthase beta chain